jgi:CheY-like chemotaxis protein
MRVVLVDDDPAVRTLVGRMLHTAGHAVATFPSAEKALESLPGGPFLLLTDLVLPGMDGLELWRRIQARSSAGRARGLLMSGSFDDESRAKAARLGIATIEKPFTITELMRSVLASDGG